jgi:hypothetical protein
LAVSILTLLLDSRFRLASRTQRCAILARIKSCSLISSIHKSLSV